LIDTVGNTPEHICIRISKAYTTTKFKARAF